MADDSPSEAMAPGVRSHQRDCVCQSCQSTRVRNKARQRAAQDPSIIPHDYEQGYQYYGCRCEKCRRAHAAYARSRYRKAPSHA